MSIVSNVVVLVSCCATVTRAADPEVAFIAEGKAQAVRFEGQPWTAGDGFLECEGVDNYLYVDRLMGPGDFRVSATLTITNLAKNAASLVINDSHFGFAGGHGQMFTEGALLGRHELGKPAVVEDQPFRLELVREGATLRFTIDQHEVHRTKVDSRLPLSIGLRPWRSKLRVASLVATGNLLATPQPPFQTEVFVGGTEDYHTFRIPALIATPRGALLAFCEGRKRGGGDAGDIDIVLRRSTDAGQTWSQLQVVADHGTNTIGNPCPVVDQSSGRIWLPLTWNLGTDTESRIMAGTSDDPRRVYLTYSDDDGLTWAPLQEISDSVRQPHWRWYATGPGVGIQLTRGAHAGRLVIPANHSDHSDPARHPYRSHVLLSDDHGKTWQLGGIAGEKTNESTIAELSDGRILDNMRSYQGQHRRAIATSQDGGETWSPVTLDEALVEPVCQASLLRYSFAGQDQKSRLLFANPASTGRQLMTVRISYDEGRTWPVSKLIHAGSAAYSCLSKLPDSAIGLLYERDGYRKITFARFDLGWLTEGQDR